MIDIIGERVSLDNKKTPPRIALFGLSCYNPLLTLWIVQMRTHYLQMCSFLSFQEMLMSLLCAHHLTFHQCHERHSGSGTSLYLKDHQISERQS